MKNEFKKVLSKTLLCCLCIQNAPNPPTVCYVISKVFTLGRKIFCFSIICDFYSEMEIQKSLESTGDHFEMLNVIYVFVLELLMFLAKYVKFSFLIVKLKDIF